MQKKQQQSLDADAHNTIAPRKKSMAEMLEWLLKTASYAEAPFSVEGTRVPGVIVHMRSVKSAPSLTCDRIRSNLHQIQQRLV